MTAPDFPLGVSPTPLQDGPDAFPGGPELWVKRGDRVPTHC
ncbi:hypothetical protein [Deinococcus radiophilus]